VLPVHGLELVVELELVFDPRPLDFARAADSTDGKVLLVLREDCVLHFVADQHQFTFAVEVLVEFDRQLLLDGVVAAALLPKRVRKVPVRALLLLEVLVMHEPDPVVEHEPLEQFEHGEHHQALLGH